MKPHTLSEDLGGDGKGLGRADRETRLNRQTMRLTGTSGLQLLTGHLEYSRKGELESHQNVPFILKCADNI